MVDKEETKPLGTWAADRMPDGCQKHPHCTYAATHDAYHNLGAVRNALPWIAPADLAVGPGRYCSPRHRQAIESCFLDLNGILL